jgi:hypothetical protein
MGTFSETGRFEENMPVFKRFTAYVPAFSRVCLHVIVFVGTFPGTEASLKARELRIEIIGNSKGTFGQALRQGRGDKGAG